MPPRDFLVIDDHPLFCEALSVTLRAMHEDCKIVTASSLAEGLKALGSGVKPDVVLLDLDLPDVDGLEGVLRVRAAQPETPIIVVSSMDDDRIIAKVLEAGAAGFIPKQTGREELESAFRQIWSGESYTPPGYNERRPAGDDAIDADDAVERLATLTPQQGRILELLCTGKLNKQIAFDLDIAEATVKAHVTVILRKLKVHSRTQAVLVAQNTRFSSFLQDTDQTPRL